MSLSYLSLVLVPCPGFSPPLCHGDPFFTCPMAAFKATWCHLLSWHELHWSVPILLISLSFHSIDILLWLQQSVLGHRCPHGKTLLHPAWAQILFSRAATIIPARHHPVQALTAPILLPPSLHPSWAQCPMQLSPTPSTSLPLLIVSSLNCARRKDNLN